MNADVNREDAMSRPKILVIGSGFAGMECTHKLEKMLSLDDAEIRMISPANHQLYLPLMPHVAAGVLTPQAIAVSLRRMLKRTIIVPGSATGVDTDAKAVIVKKISGEEVIETYDYLVLTAGSVTRQFDIPGVDQFAVGVKNLAEAAWIRDHVIAQLDLAAASDDPYEIAARLQFVVVGGGYAGVETAAYLQRLTTAAVKKYPRLSPSAVQWHLVDIAPKLMPEIGDKLGAKAVKMMEKRGVQISLGVSVAEATEDTVTLTDGRKLPCHTLIWTAGVATSPLIATTGLPTNRGRLVVHPDLTVPGLPGVFALGDAAAVPDLAKGGDAICPPTAQHAMRQGWEAAKNITAAVRGFPLHDYRHKDLGLVVDLGGVKAVAKPLGIPLSGFPAQVVARGYHIMALRTFSARFRTLAGWMLNSLVGDDFVRTGFQAEKAATLKDFEHTEQYLTTEQIDERLQAAGFPAAVAKPEAAKPGAEN